MFNNPDIETGERMAVQAFAGSWANESQFDILNDCLGLLTLAAEQKRDEGVLAVCELASFALTSIKERYLSKGKMGTTGDELQALRVLIEVSDDFWKRQSGALYSDANRALDKVREFMREAVKP